MDCLDDAAFDALVRGRLDADALSAAEAHLDTCETCSTVLSVLAGGQAPSGDEWRGATIGRHLVLEPLGRGAMGVVLLAYDPELDRRVAIKLLHPDSQPERAEAVRQRVIAEAQTMARVAHPNVVSIYDVGQIGDDVYLALEYVPGQTLRQWLAAHRREYRKVRDVFLQAGEGLSAAHAAGVVHRDFKPDNVLVGEDGRVRVTDFGLARAVQQNDPDLDAPLHEARAETEHGALIGTPAYMAPEQLAGEPATDKSDQFSFCVALWEALAERRPFVGKNVADLRSAIERGELSPPAEMPRHVQRALRRGLAFEPAQRHADMHALLTELARDPGASRRRWAGALVLVGVTLLAAVFTPSRAPQNPCVGAADVVGAVWNPARASELAAAFEKRAPQVAQAAHTGVVATLNRYAADWQTAHTATCEATHLRHEQSDELLDARMHCLNRRLDSLDATVRALSGGNREVVLRATEVASELPAVEDCADSASLGARDPRPLDSEKSERLEQVEKQLASTRVELIAGRLSSARTDADTVVRQAEDVGYRPTLAEAKLLRATVRRKLGDIANAEYDAKQALWTAQAGRADRIAARAWLELVAVAGQRGQYPEALERAEHADAAILRIDSPPTLRAQSLVQQGIAYTNLGKLTAAHTALTRALTLQEHLYGDTHVYVARTLTALGNLERARGHYEPALALHRRALAIDEKLLGRDHPSLARHHHNVAGILRALGRSEDALASYERALALEKQHLGIEHAATGLTLNSIGLIRLGEGDLDKAEHAFTESARVLTRAEHPDRALALENLGIVAARRDEPKQALSHFDAALAVVEPALGEDHERVAELLVEKAESASALRDKKTAKAAYQRALEIAREHADESERARELTTKIEAALKGKAAATRAGAVPSGATPSSAGKAKAGAAKRPSGAYGPAQNFDQF